jgi:uncharacterized protein (DUF1778 family)
MSVQENSMPERKVASRLRIHPRTRRLNIRASEEQENLIRQGAQEHGESLTDFMLRTACAEAEHALADKAHYALPPDKWAAFLRALDRPPVLKPQLQKLFSEASVLEQRGGMINGRRKKMSASASSSTSRK